MAWERQLRAALTEPAYGLAALRVAVVAILLISPELRAAPALARTPGLLLASPEGLGWLTHRQFSPQLVTGVQALAFSAGATALLGYWSRLSCGVLALAATFLLSFTERAGATWHGMHLLWLLALLAVSRSGDVWSLDAWGLRAPAASLAYGVPLCTARLLLGAVYFFPGLHKLLSAGVGWASAENVTAILYSKWFQHGRLPPVRIDAVPSLLAVGGVLVLVFELSFWLWALIPQTRLLALVAGLGFHAATQLFFFIRFPSLWVCYVVLLPWQRAFARYTWAIPGRVPGGTGWPWPSVVVGAALLLGAGVAGARGQTQAFPFACYPTFEGRFSRSAPDLLVELVAPDGGNVRLTRQRREPRSQGEWGQVYWLLGAYGGMATDAQLRQFAVRQARTATQRQALEKARTLRFYGAQYSTEPRNWGKPPERVRLLRELPGAG